MRRSFWNLLCSMVVIASLAGPASVNADSLSLGQIITVTARVAPTRSIVVNDQGQMTKIYSNTPENVTPKVYMNDVPGPSRPLTSALLQQYTQVIQAQKNLNGVAIVVPLPVTKTVSLPSILMKTISSLIRPSYL